MDSRLLDQIIHINSSSQNSTRHKMGTVKNKAITQPLSAQMPRDQMFTNGMVLNGSANIPTNM